MVLDDLQMNISNRISSALSRAGTGNPSCFQMDKRQGSMVVMFE